MKKSIKQRNLELLGLTENAQLKLLKNDNFKNLSESYEADNQKEETTLEGKKDETVEEFEQKNFEPRQEDKELYDLTNETFEIEIPDEVLKERFNNFKGQAIDDLEDDLEDDLINNYENITTTQVRKFLREFESFLDNSDLMEEFETPKENTFNIEDFYKWWGNKYKLSSDFLKKVKYELDGVGDITNDLKDLLYQLEIPIFKNNGLTQQALNKLLYNRIRQIEKENEKYPEMVSYNENELKKLKFYKSEIKNIDIIIPVENEIGIGDGFIYRIEYENGKIKVTQEKL